MARRATGSRGRARAVIGRVALVMRLVALVIPLTIALLPTAAQAQINPWIANSVYNPKEWDSAGPETATPWLHPPAYKREQGWGILPPDSALADGRWHHLTNVTGSWGGVRDELSMNRRADAAAKAATEEKVAEAPAVTQQAQIEVGAFQAVYSILGRQTVSQNGEPRRLQIDETELEAALTVRSVPRVDERAFLYAKLSVPRATPWLPGQVSLFRDGTFVGNGRLPQLAPGEEFELGFGPDDNIRVRHAVVDEKRGESGIISTSKTDQRSYRIAIKSLHERPIQLQIIDQIPVSQNQEIKVELVSRTAPTKQNLDDKRGVLSWESQLAADEEKVLEFGYRVQWPAAKRVQYGR